LFGADAEWIGRQDQKQTIREPSCTEVQYRLKIGEPYHRSCGTIVDVRLLSSRSLNQARREQHGQGSIQGSVEQAKGKVKEVVGKVTGDAKLETEGKTEQTAGKIQNSVGGFKDALKDAVND
jgi:uncharacterized protein YjbJ (UPF0337 family)